MIPKFERGILISVIFLVSSLLVTVLISPTKKEVMAPKEGLEAFNVAKAQHVPTAGLLLIVLMRGVSGKVPQSTAQ